MVTISDYVQDINERIFLPGLQREFVWNRKQTENLFDSLIREYPVGMITRWDVAHSDAEYYPYEFIRDYVDDRRAVPDSVSVEGFEKYNNEVDEDAESGTLSYLVIDGQQRLTSLFIGLLGRRIDYTKGKGGSRSNIDHWSVYELCVNLFGHPDFDGDNLAGDYEFEFRTTGEHHGNDQTGYVESSDGTERFWYPLPKMMDEDRSVRSMSEVNQEIREEIDKIDVNSARRSDLNTIRAEVLPKISSRILSAELPVKDVKKPSSEIKEIFQRINIEGESPDPYQLLLSRMMSTWPFAPPVEAQINPRRKTENWVREFKQAHDAYERKIGREIFMRYSMYLDNNVLKTGPVTQLDNNELLEIRDIWLADPISGPSTGSECHRFSSSLDDAFETLTTLGFTETTMNTTSMIAALGKFYYYNPEVDPTGTENLEQVYRFVSQLRLLKSSKGSLGRVEGTRVSNFIHENLTTDYEQFPADDAFDYLDVEIARETVEKMVGEASYGTGNTDRDKFSDWEVAAILNLSTPTFSHMNMSNIEVDHIYPKSKIEEISNVTGIDESEINIHRVGNLQLLPESVNREKGTKLPVQWLSSLDGTEEAKYKRVNNFPSTTPTPGNYIQFVEQREEQLVDEIADELGL